MSQLCLTRCIASILLPILLFAANMARAESLSTGWINVSGVELFYREGGARDAPTIVFLHGNPASSMQYLRLMELLGDRYHVLAMDYPSFGFSAAPDRKTYRYTFDNITSTVREFLRIRGVKKYALYIQDYGVPIGFRLIAADPTAITALIVQNGVIHLDGFPAAQDEGGELRSHWRSRNAKLDSRRRTFTASMQFPHSKDWQWPARVPPEFALANMISAQRPGVIDARNDLWFDYGSNVERYPAWQETLAKLDVPVLVVWGSRDEFFTTPGAFAYLRQAPHAEIHILDADHYASVEVPEDIAELAAKFLDR